jgi:phage gpG-like protein
VPGVRGDFVELRRLVLKMDHLSRPGFRQELSEVLAEEARRQLNKGFEKARDPYGAGWKKSSGERTLQDTRRLHNSFTYRVDPGGFVIGTNVLYAAIHQYGGTIKAKNSPYLRFRVPRRNGRWVRVKQVTIPQRQMVPEVNLGPIWERAFADTATEVMDELMQEK